MLVQEVYKAMDRIGSTNVIVNKEIKGHRYAHTFECWLGIWARNWACHHVLQPGVSSRASGQSLAHAKVTKLAKACKECCLIGMMPTQWNGPIPIRHISLEQDFKLRLCDLLQDGFNLLHWIVALYGCGVYWAKHMDNPQLCVFLP